MGFYPFHISGVMHIYLGVILSSEPEGVVLLERLYDCHTPGMHRIYIQHMGKQACEPQWIERYPDNDVDNCIRYD